MATKYVFYVTSCKVPCGDDCPADAVICVAPALVEPRECFEGSEDLCNFSFIEGQVVAQCYTDVGCGVAAWKLQLSYDDTQLVAETELTPSLINGVFCKDCFTSWVEELIAAVTGGT